MEHSDQALKSKRSKERAQDSKSSNNSIVSETSMEHSGQPLTSRQAKGRAHSAPHQPASATKKRNQSSPSMKHSGLQSTMNNNDIPQKRTTELSTIRRSPNPKSMSKISQQTNESANFRFNFSDLTASPISPDHPSGNARPNPDLSSTLNDDSPNSVNQHANQTDYSIARRMQNLVVQTPAAPQRNPNNSYNIKSKI